MHAELLQLYSLVLLFTIEICTENCVTPKNEHAYCVSLYKCPKLLIMLKSQEKNAINFVRQSQCGSWSNETDPKVCCSKYSSEYDALKVQGLLSNRRYCGFQHSDDYFYTGNGTAIDEFPWLAMFTYTFDFNVHNKNVFGDYGCAGSIINTRYVLTAAQCLRFRYANASGVRLGEYNTKNKTDCEEFSYVEECANPVVDIRIERSIAHPRYNRTTGVNDIALVRLNKTIQFTDYIRPICLPIPGTKFAQPNEILVTTGFGRLTYGDNYTFMKKKIYTELISNEACEREFSDFPKRKKFIIDNVICTKDVHNNTVFSCQGDFGAPVMISRRWQWHIEGFNVWGTEQCGPQYPRVYTKIVNYLDWIEKSLEPW